MILIPRKVQAIAISGILLGLMSCSSTDLRSRRIAPSEFTDALAHAPATASDQKSKRFVPPPLEVEDALLPDLGGADIEARLAKRERRFDVSVAQADARDFFMGLVADSDYNVILHPEVKGSVSISLKSVTLPEVLDAVREVYGFDYKKTPAGYVIYPAELMSRLYHVDYLSFIRNGRSETRIAAGANSQSPFNSGLPGGGGQIGGSLGGAFGGTGSGLGGFGNAYGGGGGAGGTGGDDEHADCKRYHANADGGASSANANNNSAPSSRLPSVPGSVIATTSSSNFWRELNQALAVMVCTSDGANFVVNQQSGVIVVRAFPKQLRDVERFLSAIRREVRRQVILEAKILEVQLDDGYQAGINWASIVREGGQRALTSLAGPVGVLGSTKAVGQVFTLNANVGDFSAFVELLETQGNVNTLSSPRISTLNNQKAVIKVGTDELRISNVNPGSFANNVSGGGFSPSPVLSPFFSGISLDVTPQIDDNGGVTLHVHPSVTQVDERDTRLDFGTGEQTIPLAVSSVRESDNVVLARDGQIVVIGGLMQNQERNDRQGVAGLSRLPGVGGLFRRGTGTFRKSELVILLKPTVVDAPADSADLQGEIANRYNRLDRESRQEWLP